MRYLPSSFVVHRWVVEANKLHMQPIAVSTDGMSMHLARPETIQAYNKMAADATKDNVRLKVIWAFRSSSLQQQQFLAAQQKYGRRGAIKWLAPPNFSEHQTGWALDIGDEADPAADDNPLFERTAAFRWLSRNARRYAFELSFPKSNWQGVNYEPWHWRYVGTPEARDTFHPKGIGAWGIWGVSLLEALKHWVNI